MSQWNPKQEKINANQGSDFFVYAFLAASTGPQAFWALSKNLLNG